MFLNVLIFLQEVRYADKDQYFEDATQDSSLNSSEASMGMDDYLDEALEDHGDGDDDITQDEEDDEDNSRVSRSVSFQERLFLS